MTISPRRATRSGADYLEGTAASASLVCLVHCLAWPAVMLALPFTGAWLLGSDAFHFWMLALVAPLALAAFWLGYRKHRNPLPALIGGCGVALLSAALLPAVSHRAEAFLTIVASLGLLVAHGWNWRLRGCKATKGAMCATTGREPPFHKE